LLLVVVAAEAACLNPFPKVVPVVGLHLGMVEKVVLPPYSHAAAEAKLWQPQEGGNPKGKALLVFLFLPTLNYYCNG
jgi:hypothetical protein